MKNSKWKIIISEEEEEEYQGNTNQKVEQVSSLKDLTERLEHLQSCNNLLINRGTNLQKCITDLGTQEPISHDLSTKVKSLTEGAVLFRVAATEMLNVWFRFFFFFNNLNERQEKNNYYIINIKLKIFCKYQLKILLMLITCEKNF